ncbi:cobalt-precorrin-5B (C(1))-methyltransferase [Vibrio sonorensis]|uniref:cobalt-precorrin-5B (C(1))-methyltransferase n=1 Tax=Vibrio sonorensis TaxID=1004316 RepID=UPI0008D8F64A|nr:cobalt-precorrin-5B (C(1))-methyltransferase [Vibrio sonorensis]
MGKLKRSKSNQDLRGGYTTGACAAAAARASVRALIEKQSVDEITIQIPNREWVTFPINRLEQSDTVLCGVIKDAGDDPDCTHGLEIQCKARLVNDKGIKVLGGLGVAVVTKPGLELSVGEPAINPVPKANIIEMASLEWLNASKTLQDTFGLELTIIVPDGEKAATETINERLGLVGGISILGTRGTVRPYSTSAFAASVRQAIQIAKTNGEQHVVLTTGSRSEIAAKKIIPTLNEMAFIQAGDFIGVGLRSAKRYKVKQITVVCMIGKLGKLISGRMMTHVSGYGIDFSYLSRLAHQEGIESTLCEHIASANSGRHVLDLVRDSKPTNFYNRLCKEAQQHAAKYVSNALDVEVILIDFNGEPIGKSRSE